MTSQVIDEMETHTTWFVGQCKTSLSDWTYVRLGDQFSDLVGPGRTRNVPWSRGI